MSVMLTDDFTDIARTLWGEDWRTPAAKRLRRSEKAMRNIEKGVTKRIMPGLRNELLAIVREQITVLEGYDKQFS